MNMKANIVYIVVVLCRFMRDQKQVISKWMCDARFVVVFVIWPAEALTTTSATAKKNRIRLLSSLDLLPFLFNCSGIILFIRDSNVQHLQWKWKFKISFDTLTVRNISYKKTFNQEVSGISMESIISQMLRNKWRNKFLSYENAVHFILLRVF